MALIDQIDGNTLVLTANGRLARALRLRVLEEKVQTGARAWRTPSIEAIQYALVREWQTTWPVTRLLHPAQAQAVMQQIIDASEAAERLLSTRSTTRLAMEAERVRRHYMIEMDSPMFGEAPETEAFAQWSAAYSEAKAGLDAIDFDDIYQLLMDQRPAADKVLLAGFDHLTPLQIALLDSWRRMGVAIEEAELSPDINQDVNAEVLPTFTDELHHLAGRLREILQMYQDEPDQVPSVAVAVPNYDRLRPVIASVLRQYLAPHTLYTQNTEAALPFRFTRGTPLDRHELVATALLALGLREQGNDIDDVTALLLTRRLAGNGRELEGRAKADVALRERNGRRLSFKAILEPTARHAPILNRRLQALGRVLDRHNGRAGAIVWARRFRRRLRLIGWPGDVQMSPNTAVAWRRFNEELERFASLDSTLPAMTHQQALGSLQALLAEQLFLPPQVYRAPIEIMPLEDLAGHRYDIAMAIGLDADTLPSRMNPNPFLPIGLQRAHDVPAASPQGALQRARAIAGNLQRLASDVHITCHAMTEEGAPLMPCNLFDGWRVIEPDDRARSFSDIAPLIPSIERPVPLTVDAGDCVEVNGGVKLLADYARSPFFAFANHRLKATPLPEPAEGWTADLQGVVLHGVMELVWQEIKTSAALQAMSQDKRSSLVNDSFTRVVNNPKVLAPGRISPALLQRERTRQIQVVLRWLDYEAKRSLPFEVIATERKATIEIEGLKLRIRLDRLDRVTCGGQDYHLLWDYKTGRYAATEKGWDPTSLLEPQLPAEATVADLGNLKIDGIAIAQLADGRIKTAVQSVFAGALTPDDKGNPMQNWAQRMIDWELALAANARGYREGRAELLPDALRDFDFTHGYLKALV